MDEFLTLLGFDHKPVGRLRVLESKRRGAPLVVSDVARNERLISYYDANKRENHILPERQARKKILRLVAHMRSMSPPA